MKEKKPTKKKEEPKKERRKSWAMKAKIVQNCYYRCFENAEFAETFYKNLFFLNPKMKTYFKDTDWEHQHKALLHALDHLFHFLTDNKGHHRTQLIRIAGTHSKKNLNIHPHDYYYWIDALILTLKQFDKKWHADFEFYLRECLFMPISFIISLYHKK